jgi:alpha 1,2-mannosyltransferase
MFVHYNLLKQIPSGVGRGFSWGRTKQVEDSPSTLSSSWPPNKPSYPDLEKGDLKGPTEVEADMLANVDDEGWGIMPASPEVRRRGLLERGIRPYFHGGERASLFILCVTCPN